MKIDLEHLSRLASLELTEEEKSILPGQMEKIIDWVGQLSNLPLESEEPFFPVDFSLRLDEDVVQPSLSQTELLEIAPDKQGDFVRVPRVLKEK
ncbi:MAG: Asp-tRNA(Asn)/Glu-tRNA(Gln) amidotransferase subunit GatC [Candidatus Saccharicenans sp.]|nr:Asp-tRNA(Asn)/Glu-tRNA(Gln) amidotransferase subunit GatC [Candidatus Saccharicenans sp.]